MSKVKLLIENFLVYGLGGIINKIIPLIMLPLIIRLMPSADYYGLSDLSNTIVSFGSAVAVMGLYDAMFRMFFEKNDDSYKKRVCSTTFFITLLSSILIFTIILTFRRYIAVRFLGSEDYIYIVYLSAIAILVGSTNSIVSAPARMQNKRMIYIVVNMLSSFLAYFISIPMLLSGYYTVALPISAVLSGILIEIVFWRLNKEWFKISAVDYSLIKQLLVIGVALLPNVVIYWIFNSCDKLMITNILGIGAAGIYAVGSKLGHCSQLIYTAFAGGWQYFAFSTMREKGQVKVNSKIYEYLGVVSFICTAFICACSFTFYKILFAKEYLSGYIIAPYLFLAPLLQMLYQIGNNQFLVIKKAWPGMFILSSGAIVNIIFNYVLIPILGIEGAAIATITGYIVVCIIDIIVLEKCKLMAVSPKFLLIVIGMVIYFILWRLFYSTKIFIGLIAAVIYMLYCYLIYKKEFKNIIKKGRRD